MTITEKKIEETPVVKVPNPEAEKTLGQSADVGLELEDFKKKILTDIESLKGIDDAVQREAKRVDILNTLASKQVELKSLKETVGFKRELADLFTATIDELKQKVEDDRKENLHKNISTKALDVVKEKWEKLPNGLKSGLTIAGGVVSGYLVFKGLQWGWNKLSSTLFGSKNDKKEDDKKSSGNWFTKFLGIGAGAGVLYTLYDKFFGGSGKWRWERNKATVSEGLGDIQDANIEFNKLETPKKEQYNAYGNTVNSFYGEISKFSDGTIPDGTDYVQLGSADQKLDATAGVIPYMLDNSFKNIDEMNSEAGLFHLDNDATIAQVSKKIAELVGKGSGKLAGWIMKYLGFEGVVDPQNIEKQATELLTGKNNLDDAKLIFRKILKVVSFTNYAENVLIDQEVQKSLSTGGTLYKRGKPARDGSVAEREVITYDKNDTKLIHDITSHPEKYKVGELELGDLKKKVRSNTLAELSAKVSGLDLKKVQESNKDLTEAIHTYNTERDEMQVAIEKDKNGTLDKMKNNVEDQLAGSMTLSLERKLPLLHLFDRGGAAEGTKDALKKDANFQLKLKEFKDQFEKLKGEQDVTKIKKKIDDYYATLKEISVAEAAADEIVDENGNKGIRLLQNVKNMFSDAYTNMEYGSVLFFDGEGHRIEGALWVLSGAVSAGVPLYLVLTGSGRKVLARGVWEAGKVTAQAGAKTITVLSGRASLSSGKYIVDMLDGTSVGRSLLRNSMFAGENGKSLFRYYYLNGDISTAKANAFVSHNSWEKGADDIFQYLKNNGILHEGEDVKLLQHSFAEGRDYMANPSLRKMLFKPADANILQRTFTPQNIRFDIQGSAFKALEEVEAKIADASTGPIKKELFTKLMQEAQFSSIDEIKNLVHNMDNITEDMLKNVRVGDLVTDISRNIKGLSDPVVIKNLLKNFGSDIEIIEKSGLVDDIVKGIDKDIGILTKEANLPAKLSTIVDKNGVAADMNAPIRNAAKNQIKELEGIKNTLNLNKAVYHIDDLKIIEKVYGSGLEPRQIAAVLHAIGEDTAIVTDLMKGDTRLLQSKLLELGYGEKIFGKDLKIFEKLLPQFDKGVFKLVGKFGEKTLFKMFGQVLKII